MAKPALQRSFAVLTAIAVTVGLGQSGVVLHAQTGDATVVHADLDGFTKAVKSSAEQLKVPGYTVAVVQGGKIIYRLNSGDADVQNHLPVTDHTLFSLASVTKSFTAIMMMQYEDEKKISLDDYLLDYPLDTSKYVPSTIDVNTKLKHVLSMTSGDVPA
jgi:CubicO group peptidase (beta-lactamase class C family)